MSQYLKKRLVRAFGLLSGLVLKAGSRHRLERRRRGAEEFRRLKRADFVVVSYGKSGRTWLRVLLSRFFQLRGGLAHARLIGIDGWHHGPDVPRVFFTHDNYLRDYTGNLDSKRDFYSHKLVLLVRHPTDVAVSQYFQWKYRMLAHKKGLNRYPEHGAELGLFEFVMGEEAGLPRIVEFMNGWSTELPQIGDALVMRYEDLHADTAGELGRLLRFMGQEPTGSELDDCVAFASAENMRQLEAERAFQGGKMRTRDAGNPNARKVRRAQVGGWRQHVDATQAGAIERLIEASLVDGFGYLAREQGGAQALLVGQGR